MWIRKRQWCEALWHNAENEGKIKRLELRVSKLEELLREEMEKWDKPLEQFIDGIIEGGGQNEPNI